MHWNVILADAPAAPAQTTASAPPAQGTSTTQTAQPGQSGQPPTPFGGGFGIFMPLILIFIIVYFMSMRPQQQRAKQMAKLLASLKSGDKVITSSGIVGVVITINDKDGTVSIRSKEAKIEVTKSSITEIRPSDDTQTSP